MCRHCFKWAQKSWIKQTGFEPLDARMKHLNVLKKLQKNQKGKGRERSQSVCTCGCACGEVRQRPAVRRPPLEPLPGVTVTWLDAPSTHASIFKVTLKVLPPVALGGWGETDKLSDIYRVIDKQISGLNFLLIFLMIFQSKSLCRLTTVVLIAAVRAVAHKVTFGLCSLTARSLRTCSWWGKRTVLILLTVFSSRFEDQQRSKQLIETLRAHLWSCSPPHHAVKNRSVFI